eukprot:TRINITY_DN1197_c0_g1_i1.p2 TRINITY_DN1197_c0_g1~~TRINITY_DN1197_c0_g1_i1.p2  ORF type:complete len:244 (-),score=87.46 TRINITY_DN1197_c0_g1_i1:323-1054(-)
MAFLARAARPSMRLMTGIPTLQVSRSFAAAPSAAPSAARAVEPKVPLRIYGLAGRYAHALFDSASQTKQLDKIEAEVKAFMQLVDKTPELQAVLSTPVLASELRVAAVNLYLDQIKASPVTRRFFALLAESGRAASARAIVDAFQRLMADHRNEVSAVVISASALSPALLARLSEKLKNKFLRPQDTLQIQTKIDESMIAGFQVQLGEKFIDMSLKTELDQKIRSIRSAMDAYFDRFPKVAKA